jgi:hypothetical protein
MCSSLDNAVRWFITTPAVAGINHFRVGQVPPIFSPPLAAPPPRRTQINVLPVSNSSRICGEVFPLLARAVINEPFSVSIVQVGAAERGCRPTV